MARGKVYRSSVPKQVIKLSSSLTLCLLSAKHFNINEREMLAFSSYVQ